MDRGSRAAMADMMPEAEWTKKEDDLLFSLLYTSQLGVSSEARRPWKNIAVDMNAEALRLGLKTRFFHHENVHARWWLKYGRFFAAEILEEAQPSQATDTAASLAPLRDILARVGVESLNGQLLSPPARKGFELPRAVYSVETAHKYSYNADLPPVRTTVPETALCAPNLGTQFFDHDEAQMDNEVKNGIWDECADGDASGGMNDRSKLILATDGKGKRVRRDPRNSWLL